MFNNKTLRHSLLALALSACSSLASAASTFHIELDTSAFAGTGGWIDVQFNPSPIDPLNATADLSSILGFGDASTAQLINVSGSAASGFHMSSGAAGGADLFHEVSFASGKISFNVTIGGDAGASQSGSAFAIALLNANQDAALGSVGADGYNLLHLDYTPAAGAGGKDSLIASGYDASSVHVSAISAVPEAETWAMMAAGLAMIGLVRRRKQA